MDGLSLFRPYAESSPSNISNLYYRRSPTNETISVLTIMAILSQVPGIEVFLRINNERMNEYRCSPEMLNSTMSGSANHVPSYHCYIASEADKPYCIECVISSPWNFPKDVDALIFDVSVDGQLFATGIVRQQDLNHSDQHVVKVESRHCNIGGQSYLQSLKFGALVPDEEADCDMTDRDPKRSESMGQIIVEVWYGKQGPMTKEDTLNEPLRPLSKALFKNVIIGNGDVTHGTCYQNTKNDHSPSFCHYSFGPKRNFGIYHFHYRPYDTLVAKGVISSGIHAMAVPPRTISSETEQQLMIDLTGEDD
ncbi:hypothetical protein AU210_016256 [Fusarium oxysporum f. sp. radicis-cucumerinum]|uniref:DUF7918 domain-containing protein n=1 Tax=Fusarium oxysporum f. sp. radicis-cucumerinum TaxID=327505 RepID=A0A2H3FS81_FUSOX|nr:hypothetical protein AU210_016256 [Fusarium oxysporum f. sp. radicis-cucumerinum]